MQPTDNSQFTEEQRTEAFRQAVMAQMQRQTKHLDAIRTILTVFTVLFVIGAVFYLLTTVTGA